MCDPPGARWSPFWKRSRPRSVRLEAGDFARGPLRLTSFVRPGKLVTAHASLMASQIGELQANQFAAIREAVKRLIRTQ